MQKTTSDAHSNTYSINANFEGLSYVKLPEGKFKPQHLSFPQERYLKSVLQHLAPPPNPDLDRGYLEEEVDPGPKKSKRFEENPLVFIMLHSSPWKYLKSHKACQKVTFLSFQKSVLMTQSTAPACNPQLHRDFFLRLKKPAAHCSITFLHNVYGNT